MALKKLLRNISTVPFGSATVTATAAICLSDRTTVNPFLSSLSNMSQPTERKLKMNVLVYHGHGTTSESVKQCVETLRNFLSPHYAVFTVDAPTLRREPWMSSTALLVMPGGADLPFCNEFNGEGNTIITRFVRRGGRFLGFCAGGYYGSSFVEFEVGRPGMEVSGPRELQFFPGVCRGGAYKGFVYEHEDGARAAPVRVNRNVPEFADLADFKCYYNGGGVFVNADSIAKSNTSIQVLASYNTDEEPLNVDGDSSSACVVYCKVGQGNVILTGIHPEFSPSRMKADEGDTHFSAALAEMKKSNEGRENFVRALLLKLGLRVNEKKIAIPRLTPLKLTAAYPGLVKSLVESLAANVGFRGDEHNLLVGQNDTFRFIDSNNADALLSQLHINDEEEEFQEYEDVNKVVKNVEVFYSGLPDRKSTPYFNVDLYYKELKLARENCEAYVGDIGTITMYGEVVTSTSTMLDKNYNILQYIPHGFCNIGTIQVAGRGRGGNPWVNPPGVLAVSTVLRMPLEQGQTSPIVFVQYLCSLAMVEAIKGYGPQYEEMPVAIKWPNDVYTLNPSELDVDIGELQSKDKYLKLGGTLVNTNVVNKEYVLIFGSGINVSNEAPTTSLNMILGALNKVRAKRGQPALESFKIEKLLAKFLTYFEEMFTVFKYQGFRPFEQLYYSRWLHTDQIVHLESHENIRAQIKGITMEFGMLIAEEVNRENKPTGRKFELQPDGNSFDMFKGLISRKVN